MFIASCRDDILYSFINTVCVCVHVCSWLDVVEHEFAIRLNKSCVAAPVDVEAVGRLRSIPTNWTIQQDEDLAQFLGKQADPNTGHLGSIQDYVDAIEVSSKSVRSSSLCIFIVFTRYVFLFSLSHICCSD